MRNATSPWEGRLYYLIAAAALVYAFARSFRTVADFDLGWLLATGRWIVSHHQIPSTEVFSYTAAGQPWIYPAGAGMVFYGGYLLGGFAFLSWLSAAACVGTVALLLRRASALTAALVLIAIPVIADRTTERAEIFTNVLFAAVLHILWTQHETGRGRLWSLPLLMVAWVNLHPGFIAGLGLLAAYVMLEVLDLVDPARRAAARQRLRAAAPWLMAACGATLVNPWGWGIYEVIARQQEAIAAHSQLITEWAPRPVNWTLLLFGLTLRQPFYALLLILFAATPIAVWRRRFGAAILLAGTVYFPLRHERFGALFGCVLVVVGGAVLTPLVRDLAARIPRRQLRPLVAALACAPLLWWVGSQTADQITNRSYLTGTAVSEFGAGLSWWFPQQAADFVERENIPGQIFSASNEGGYLAFRLGPKYPNYIDGRDIPFGTELIMRSGGLKTVPPSAPQWQEDIERYHINTILVPIGRFVALQFFPVLKQFCESDSWTPVYLDEVSVVFVRNTPQTESLTQRLRVNCAAAPLPRMPNPGFQQWANAAAVLNALDRDSEALKAADKALAIVPENGQLHFLRGHILQNAGRFSEAETDYLQATKYAPDMVAPWSALATFYEQKGRLPEAISAWESAARVSQSPWQPLLSLGYTNLQAQRPQDALNAFDHAASSLPEHSDLLVDNNFLANIAHGRARACYRMGDLSRALSFETEATRLLPNSADLWQQLADLYDRAGQHATAAQVRAQLISRAN